MNQGISMIKPGAWLSPDKRTLVLKMNDPSRITGALPPTHCKVKPFSDFKLVALPYKMDTLQILRNMGLATDGIEILRHKFNLPLIEGCYAMAQHQITQSVFLSENRRAFITSTMRTGKTASAVFATRALQGLAAATGVLIIATVSNMRGVWEKEITGMYPTAKVAILHDKSAETRRALLESDADFYVVNYDGVKILQDELAEAVEQGRINTCIVDELTHYANSRTQLWEAADKVINGTRWRVIPGKVRQNPDGSTTKLKDRKQYLPSARRIEYCWGLTGTPGDPEMIYGQVKLIKPENMKGSFVHWRDETMVKNGFKWIPREGHMDKIYRVMQPCMRFDKKDIMDLPPVMFAGRECELSSEQKKLYNQIKKDMVALAADGTKVTAVSKAALVSKLLQIASGVVIGENGNVPLDMTPRMDELDEIIKSATQKVVVFCAFTAVIDRLNDELVKRGYSVGIVDGRVTGKKRDDVFHAFQNTPNPHIILCHPKTTAFGVELAAADTMVFFGPPMSGEFVYQQAIERMSSLKQKASSVQIIHLSSVYEERKMFQSIKDGVSVNEAINGMFTQASSGY